jgi:hypothetical protein
MPYALVRSWFSHKPKVGRDRAEGRPLILEVPFRKGVRSLGGKRSRTLPPYIPVDAGSARLLLGPRCEGGVVGGGVSLVPQGDLGTLGSGDYYHCTYNCT